MLVFIDSRHVSGYGYTGLLGELKETFNNVQTFEYPKDIDECHLTGAVEKRLGAFGWRRSGGQRGCDGGSIEPSRRVSPSAPTRTGDF